MIGMVLAILALGGVATVYRAFHNWLKQNGVADCNPYQLEDCD